MGYLHDIRSNFTVKCLPRSSTVKRKCSYFGEILITGYIEGCHLITSDAASDGNFIQMTFSFECYKLSGSLIIVLSYVNVSTGFVIVMPVKPWIAMLIFFFMKYKNMFAFSIHTGAGNFIHSPWKTMPYLYYSSNFVVADDLATQGARASTAFALTYFCPEMQIAP